MKLLLVFLLTLSSFCLNAQNLDGFWGVRFGASIDSAKIIIKKKTTVTPKLNSDKDILSYENVTFGGRTADVVKLYFYKNQLYGGTVFYIPEKDPEILSLYRNIKNEVAEKYWEPQIDVESYKSPYSKDDGFELSAIKGGYATIGAIWYFPNSFSNEINHTGTIMISVEPKIWIELAYRGGQAYEDFKKELQKNKQSDY